MNMSSNREETLTFTSSSPVTVSTHLEAPTLHADPSSSSSSSSSLHLGSDSNSFQNDTLSESGSSSVGGADYAFSQPEFRTGQVSGLVELKPPRQKYQYTSENLASDVEVDDNSKNEVGMLGNFSPVSVSQTDSSQPMNQPSSQSLRRKRSGSGDPIAQSMDRLTNLLKEAFDKTNGILDKLCQVLANNKVNENQILVVDLQKMQLSLLDQIHVMRKFMQKPEIAAVFKAQSNEEQKLQLVISLLSGAFDG